MESTLRNYPAQDNRPHIPNEETRIAIKEASEHLQKLESGETEPRFNNLSDFFISLFSSEDD